MAVIEAVEEVQEHAALLRAAGARPVERGPWLVVGASPLKHGWKLHLSSIPTQAVALLDCILPMLVRESVSFKCARTPEVLAQLNEGNLGNTQVGKFVTIYPKSPTHARDLAFQLVTLTAAFDGPVVPTDLALGGVVYARYGGHNPIIARDRLGQLTPVIEWPNGRVASDYYQVPFSCPEDVENPFAGLERSVEQRIWAEDGSAIEPASPKLFGPGYLVVDLIREQAKGSVYRAVDLRTQAGVSAKVLKQGRRHCLSDSQGRDMRDRLRHQRALHARLSSCVPVPNADLYFEAGGDGYLVLDYIPGQTIESKLSEVGKRRVWSAIPQKGRMRIMGWLRQLLEATRALHSVGYVHRDIAASNVWIGEDERLWLLDLELAHELSDTAPAFGLGTAGFMSPQQEQRYIPALADDIYGIGSVFILSFTGLDPRRVLFGGRNRLREHLSVLTGVAKSALLDVAARAVAEDPSVRPSLAELAAALEEGSSQSRARFAHRKVLEPNLVPRVLEGLLGPVPRDHESGMWLSVPIATAGQENGNRIGGTLELRKSANRGVAGTVYFLSRAASMGYAHPQLQSDVERAVRWLATDKVPDAGLPGLHFGEAGVSVAIAEALKAGLIPLDGMVLEQITAHLRGVLDWPDITHGAAGQGIAALICADTLPGQGFEVMARQSAEYLIRTQEADGSWRMPAGVPGMSGETLSGFAHGVAGIVYFLAIYDFKADSQSARDAWRRGLAWLERAALKNGQALEWAYSDTRPVRWRWWCHGGPGIALTFLKIFELTREARAAELARAALATHPTRVVHSNLTQCHGLSGLGEVYLEAARVLDEPRWMRRADSIGEILLALSREGTTGGLVWLAEDPYWPTADLMVGGAGVGHFLLRHAHPGRLSPPLLP